MVSFFFAMLVLCSVTCLVVLDRVTVPLNAYIASKAKSGSGVRLLNFNNSLFVGPVLIDGQTFSVVYDTGSSIAWVPGSNCKSDACLNHNSLQIQNENKATRRETLHYGTGSVELEFHKANVEIDAVKGAAWPGLLVGTAEQVSTEPFVNLPMDGIFGLGFSPEGTPMDNASAVDRSEPSTFTFSFDDDGGALAWNKTFDDANYNWLNLSSFKYWEVSLNSVSVNGTAVIGFCEVAQEPKKFSMDRKDSGFVEHDLGEGSDHSVCNAAFDTGSSMVMMPGRLVSSIRSLLGINESVGDCEHMKHLAKRVCLNFKDSKENDFSMCLEPEDYIVPLDETAKEQLVADSELCLFGFMAMDVPEERKLVVVGLNLLSKYESVYDFSKARVGLRLSK